METKIMDASSEFIACKNLQSCAKRAGILFMDLAIKRLARDPKTNTTLARIAEIAEIGTKLFRLAFCLADPAFPIQPGAEGDARKLLLALGEVFIEQPATGEVDTLGEIQTGLDAWYYNREASREARRALIYFGTNPDKADKLIRHCDSLWSKVSPESERTALTLPKSFRVPEPNRYESFVNESLYSSIKIHMKCDHTDNRGCERPTSEPCVDTWLPTRLRLGGPLQSANWAKFDVVTSSLKQGFWNEFRWVVPTQNTIEKKSTIEPHRVKFDLETAENMEDEDDDSIDDYHMEPLHPGYICDMLVSSDASIRTKLKFIPGTGLLGWKDTDLVEPLLPHSGVDLSKVFQNYCELTVKDKITLAHTVAQAFWQLYASDMMPSVWTSKTIWFMHEDKRGDNGVPVPEILDVLSMSPYIVFNFGCDGKRFDESPEWLGGRRPVPHQFPHILALGALLLDIGLGKYIGRADDCADYRNLQTRDDMVLALGSVKTGLQELENIQWDGFNLHKPYFTGAIKFCANYKDQDSKRALKSSPVARENTVIASTSDNSLAVMKRKKALYENVIRPLAWLAGAFHENNSNVTCAYTLPTSYLQKRPLETSGPTVSTLGPGDWRFKECDQWRQTFWNFTALTNSLIESIDCERQQIPPKFKIAILDTGYNAEMACFKERREAGQILGQISWLDFASSSPSPQPVDEDGHGSYMTQLVMNAAPLADIQVIRVVRTREELLESKKIIANAIFQAGRETLADVISMSFGFEGDDINVWDIHEAITMVHLERKGEVIFLAAGGNDSSLQTNMFPARHSNVISMHATNNNGDFLLNSSTSECRLGTFSQGPEDILQEVMTEYPDLRVDRQTSSAATAIGAGIVALTLAHISVLQCAYSHSKQRGIDFNISPDYTLDQLRLGTTMEKVLREMAIPSGQNSSQLFVNPIRFWKGASKKAKDNKGMHLNILKDIDHFVRKDG
ncbi:hypothetical protein J3E68DRAFT_420361 [Trichoderma sp. SZMC 28012]